MRKVIGAMLLLTGAAFAQTAETIPFRAILLPSNEVPAINIAASGAGTVWLHVVRDASGKVVSASTDFNTSYSFPGPVNITGMHIHKGAAGVNGPVTISSGIAGGSPVVDATGKGTLVRQGQTPATDAAGLDTVNGMLADPSGFYLNVHTSDNPGGVIRGQLQRAQMVVLMGPMSGSNEVPAVDTTGSAMSSVIALMTKDASGAVTSGQVIFDANYTGFPEGTVFTGFHIHNGPAGVNAPVVINTGVSGTNSVTAAAGGGNLHYEVEVPATAVAFTTLSNLFTDPGGNYINLHTTTSPGGIIRSQLRRTDQLRFPVLLSPANEVPAITLDASAPSTFTAYTLRDNSGAVTAATVIFDSNVRFPGPATFTGMHIHDGKAGVNGPVTLNSGLSGTASVVADSGMANIYRVVNMNTATQLASLNSLVQNPENHYYNIHTTVNPGGIVRSQLVPTTTALPGVNAVISAISDPARKTVAPGGLMTIFGSDLIKVPGDILASSTGTGLPNSYNGTSATLGGTAVPLLVAAPGYIVAQVPVDAKPGSQMLVVKNSNGTAQALAVDVAAAAPAIFFDGNGGIFLKNSDYSLVTRANPAKAGDVVLIYSTGLGVTTPALQSGVFTPQPGASNTFYNTVKPAVTVGAQNANVIYSLASPGFAGLYQTAITIPAGAGTGSVPVTLKIGDAASNTVNIALQ